MDDLISRQAAIEAIEKYDFSFPEYMERFVTELRDAMKEDLKDDIANLPSAQPEQRWIPCSERLPDKNGKYLVVGRQKAINILKFDGGRWYGKWGVVAWMPLPEPYREERTEE